MEIIELLDNLGKVCGVAVEIGKVLKIRGITVEVLSRKKKEKIKDEVAIVVDFNEISVKAVVEKYLEARKIDSTVLICSNPAGDGRLDLDNEDQWRDAVKGFYQVLKKLQETAPEKIHIFISAPVALAFAIGYVSRPLQPYVYQFDNANRSTAASRKYAQIMRVTDELRVW